MTQLTRKRKHWDTRAWRVSLNDDEWQFCQDYMASRDMTIRNLFDQSMAAAIENGGMGGMPEMVMPAEDHVRRAIRIDKELLAQLTEDIKLHVYYGLKKPVNTGNVLLTALWSYMEANPVEELEARRQMLSDRLQKASIREPRQSKSEADPWKLSFTDEELAFFTDCAASYGAVKEQSSYRLKHLIEEAMGWIVNEVGVEHLRELALPSPDSNRKSFRIQSDIYDRMAQAVAEHDCYGLHQDINTASMTVTALWRFVEYVTATDEQDQERQRLWDKKLVMTLPKSENLEMNISET